MSDLPSTVDPVLVDTLERLLEEHCSPALVGAAEAGEWPAELWSQLQALDLTRAWIPADRGGPGTSLADGFAIVNVAAAHAAPVPLAETLLAGWLLSQGGLPVPDGALSVAPVRPADRVRLDASGGLSGTLEKVPYARQAEHVVVVTEDSDGPRVALIGMSSLSLQHATNLAGEPADTLMLGDVEPVALSHAVPSVLVERLERMGACLRAQQMAGALKSVLSQTLDYARDREQFGRAIARFQAVQHNLAVLAGEVAAAGVAADGAVSAIARHGYDSDAAFIAIASAKIRAGEAAGSGAAIAHQVHGAMGFTLEYSLQQRTRRLWSWRDDFGSETRWSIALGRHIAARGADALWPALTAI